MMNKNTNIPRIYNIIIRLLIVIFAYLFIYKQVFYKKELHSLLHEFEDLFRTGNFFIQLGFIIVLMLINWSLETFKWKYLIQKIERIRFGSSFKAVMSGITVSTFTPNRVGEYFGRVFIFKQANYWDGILITIIGSMSQLLVTLITGIFALLFFVLHYFDLQQFFFGYARIGLVFSAIVLSFFLIFLYFNVSLLSSLQNRLKWNWIRRIKRHLRVFSLYTNRQLAKVLFLSIMRYCVFSIQFYLLLKLFGVNLPLSDGLMFISLIFFVMTIIPTIALSELGIRGSIAIYFIGMYFDKFSLLNEQINLGILTASVMLWLINLAIPALIGSFFVFNLKFFRR